MYNKCIVFGVGYYINKLVEVFVFVYVINVDLVFNGNWNIYFGLYGFYIICYYLGLGY